MLPDIYCTAMILLKYILCSYFVIFSDPNISQVSSFVFIFIHVLTMIYCRVRAINIADNNKIGLNFYWHKAVLLLTAGSSLVRK